MSVYCVRCGRKHSNRGGAYCESCHPLVLKEIRERPPCMGDLLPLAGTPPPPPILKPSKSVGPAVVITCAECGKERPLYGHILGRPYCSGCLAPSWRRFWGLPSLTKDEPSPAWENAVRVLEDGRG